jgi:hypothetical protein
MSRTITIEDVREIKFRATTPEEDMLVVGLNTSGGTATVLENEDHQKAEALIKFMRSKPKNVVID